MTNEDLKALALAAIDQEQRWKEAGEPWPIWNTRLLEMQAAANPAAVLGLIEDNERLETYKAAYMEWSDKTDWVQETAEVRELGKHRADVIRERFDALKAALEHEQARVTDYIAQRAQSDRNCDALKAECEGLRKALSECATSLEGEMLQKFHGQKPDDMHPVTRREYGRDMEELAGYRTALGQGGQSNG